MENMPFNRRELEFQLYEFAAAETLCQDGPFADHDRAGFDAIIDSALRVANEKFAPHAATLDAQEPQFVDGRAVTPPELKEAVQAYVDGGFMGLGFPAEAGGLGLPYTVSQAVSWCFNMADGNALGYPFLTMAAANLIRVKGSAEQQQRYMRPMIAGRWFGTMALSEPQAGSSLADIRTRAEPRGDGSYAIKGTKMWISAAEHELSENIIHLVLAKVPGGPPGTKGISLFIVPKFRLTDDGACGEWNHIALAGLNHKMGNRGTTNTLLNFGEGGESIGYLVGDLHDGLAGMFHMMNEARIGVGFGAAVAGYLGYLHSLDYARERPQGRPAGVRDASTPQVALIEHPDVRRMLLAQKAISEGALALCFHGARLVDDLAMLDEGKAREDCELELAILTPIIKAWISHYSLEANYWGLQILGGYGYTREFPLERIYRDNRLNPIHEGTNGIQSLDLLGRKVTMRGGAAFKLLISRIQDTVAQAGGHEELSEYAAALAAGCETVATTTMTLGQAAGQGQIDRFLANSWVYLDMLGHLVVAWIWLRQALLAQAGLATASDEAGAFYRGKLHACRYFFRWELPKIEAQARLLSSLDDTLLGMPVDGY